MTEEDTGLIRYYLKPGIQRIFSTVKTSTPSWDASSLHFTHTAIFYTEAGLTAPVNWYATDINTQAAALATTPPCTPPSTLTSGEGFTRADCCINGSLPTCQAFATLDYSTVMGTKYSCIASYEGYGPYRNTPCEGFYRTEGKYYTRNMPSGNVFTDYTDPRQPPTLGCYVESWSKYRVNGYAFDLEKSANYAACDEVYYAFELIHKIHRGSGHGFLNGFHEPHDEAALQFLGTLGIPVYLTLGGWTDQGTVEKGTDVHAALKEFSKLANFISHTVRSFKLQGVDFDIEWPGQRGFPPSGVPDLVHFILKFCTENTDIECHAGILPAGGPFNPWYYNQISPVISRFNIFGYDMYGAFDTRGMQIQDPILSKNSTAWSITLQYENILKHTVLEPYQLAHGMPLYTRGYRTNDAYSIEGGGPPAKSDHVDYNFVMQEEGQDILAMDPSIQDVIPYMCTQNTHTVTSLDALPNHLPTDQNVKACEYQLTTGQYSGKKIVIPFRRLDGYKDIMTTLDQDYAITNFYVYAHSMLPAATSLLKGKLPGANGRSKRSVSTPKAPAYAYPRSTGSGVSFCPGILYYSTTITVTSAQYEGCYQPEGSYCFYPTEFFSCTPISHEPHTPEVVEERCTGVDTVLLLPSTSLSNRIACLLPGTNGQNVIKFYRQQTSLCVDQQQPASEGLNVELPVASHLQEGFQDMTSKEPTETELSYTTIKLPMFCNNFTKPLSCTEFVCGADTTCIGLLQESVYSEYCQQISRAITEYENGLQQVLSLQQAIEDTTSQLKLEAATRSITGVTHTPATRKKRSALLIGGLMLGGLFMFSNNNKIKENKQNIALNAQNIDQLKNAHNEVSKRTTALETNVQELQVNFNDLVSNVQTLAENTEHQFTAVSDSLNELDSRRNQLQASVNQKFATMDNQISILTNNLNQLEQKFEVNVQLSGATSSYTAHILSLTSKLQNLRSSLLQYYTLIQSCLSSVVAGSFASCTTTGNTTVPISIELYRANEQTTLIFTYLEFRQYQTTSYKGAFQYCEQRDDSGTIQEYINIAAQGCRFAIINDTVFHMTEKLNFCDEPYTTYQTDCSQVYAKIITQKRPPPAGPSVTPNITVPEPTLPDYTPEDFNITFPELDTLNKSVQDSLKQLQDELEALKVKEDQIVTDFKALSFSTTSSIYRSCMDILIWIMAIGFIILACVLGVMEYDKQLRRKKELPPSYHKSQLHQEPVAITIPPVSPPQYHQQPKKRLIKAAPLH